MVLYSDESSEHFQYELQVFIAQVEKDIGQINMIPFVKHPPSQMIEGAVPISGIDALYCLLLKTTIIVSLYLNFLHVKLKLHMDVYRYSIFTHNGGITSQ